MSNSRKRKKNNNGSSNNFLVPTIEQLVELNTLIVNNKALAEQTIRPLQTLINYGACSILTPLASNLIIMTYQEELKNLATKSSETIIHLQDLLLQPLRTLISPFCKLLKGSAGMTDIIDCLSRLGDLEDDVLNKHNIIVQLREQIIHLMKLTAPYLQHSVFGKLLDNKFRALEKQSNKAIIKLFLEMLNHIQRESKASIDNLKLLHTSIAKLVFNVGFIPINYFSPHVLNYTFIDNLQLLNANFINPQAYATPLTFDDAQNKIDNLTKKNLALKKNALMGQFINILLTTILFSLVDEKNIPEIIAGLLISLAWSQRREIKNYYEHRKFEQKLKNIELLLCSTMQPIMTRCSVHRGATLGDSQIILTIAPYENLSKKVVTKNIKNILIQHGIKHIYQRGCDLIIMANNSLTPRTAETLRKAIAVDLENRKTSYRLKKQCLKLIDAFKIASNKLTEDFAKFLPQTELFPITKNSKQCYQLFIRIAENHSFDFNQLCKTFPHSSLQVNGKYMTFTAECPAEEAELNELIAYLYNERKNLLTLQEKQQSLLALPPVEHHLVENHPQKKNSDGKYLPPLIAAPQQNKKSAGSPHIATWQGIGSYNSAKQNANIFPLRNPALPKNRFFVANQITAHHCSDAKLREEIDNAAHGGAHRVKFIEKRWMKDTSGRLFEAKLKLKLGDAYGNSRAYGEEVVNKDGQVVYVIKGIEMRAHRK